MAGPEAGIDSDVEDCPAIVLDVGSHCVKAGLQGHDAPSCVFPHMVGREGDETFVGPECEARRDRLDIHCSMEGGVVQNWDNWEKVLHYTFFNALRVAPEDHPVILTHGALTPAAHREKMTQIMFETFNVPAMYIAPAALLSLFACGKTTGVVVDSGHDTTDVVPIYQGFPMHHAIRRLEFGGRGVTDGLSRMLLATPPDFQHRPACDLMKQDLCYVAENDSEFLKEQQKVLYELPWTSISVGYERFHAPEALFRPALFGLGFESLPDTLVAAVNGVEEAHRAMMLENIVVSGGNTLLEGFPQRLENEVSKLAGGEQRVEVLAPCERAHSAWIGGAVIASLPSFQQLWTSKDEYDEAGPPIPPRRRAF